MIMSIRRKAQTVGDVISVTRGRAEVLPKPGPGTARQSRGRIYDLPALRERITSEERSRRGNIA